MRTGIALLLGIAFGLAAPAWGGELDRTFPVGSGGKLVIALDFGSVAVRAHDEDTVHIEAVSRGVGASSVHFDARAEGETVFFEGSADSWVHWLQSNPGVRVRAWVPADYPVEIDGSPAVEIDPQLSRVPLVTP